MWRGPNHTSMYEELRMYSSITCCDTYVQYLHTISKEPISTPYKRIECGVRVHMTATPVHQKCAHLTLSLQIHRNTLTTQTTMVYSIFMKCFDVGEDTSRQLQDTLTLLVRCGSTCQQSSIILDNPKLVAPIRVNPCTGACYQGILSPTIFFKTPLCLSFALNYQLLGEF